MEIKEVVQQKYGGAARRVSSTKGLPAECCAGLASSSCDPITSNRYDIEQQEQVPEVAMRASLGCGNPTVLDLGSGG